MKYQFLKAIVLVSTLSAFSGCASIQSRGQELSAEGTGFRQVVKSLVLAAAEEGRYLEGVQVIDRVDDLFVEHSLERPEWVKKLFLFRKFCLFPLLTEEMGQPNGFRDGLRCHFSRHGMGLETGEKARRAGIYREAMMRFTKGDFEGALVHLADIASDESAGTLERLGFLLEIGSILKGAEHLDLSGRVFKYVQDRTIRCRPEAADLLGDSVLGLGDVKLKRYGSASMDDSLTDYIKRLEGDAGFSVRLAPVYSSMARLSSMGPLREAIEWRKKAVRGNRHLLSPCDKIRVQYEVSLARFLHRAGRKEEALGLFDQLIASKSLMPGTTCFARMLEIKHAKAATLTFSGNQDLARPIVIGMLREIGATKNWGAADYWAILRARIRMLAVAVMFKKKESGEFDSEAEIKKSCAELEGAGLGSSYWAGELWRLWGNILRFSGKRKQAISRFEKSEDIYKSCCPQGNRELLAVLTDHANTLRESGFAEKAAELERLLSKDEGQGANLKKKKISQATLKRIRKLISRPIDKCLSSVNSE